MQEDWEIERSEPEGNHCLRFLQEILFVLLAATDLLLMFCEKFQLVTERRMLKAQIL